MSLRLSLCLLLLAPAIARADDDPDVQAARRHFLHGQQLYDQEKYEEAAREFTTAEQLKPIPAFDYNIARCFERLERWGEAADAYERYLAADPSASGAADIRRRIEVLRARSRETRPLPANAGPKAETPTAEPPKAAPPVAGVVSVATRAKRPVYKRAWFWTVVSVGAGAVAVGVALGLTLGRTSDSSHPIMDVRF